ncbi:MAG: arsenate reductase ArsC [Methanomassiliicoccales archaeon]|nr:arsenate reductase ArsC [Methanomassiliicoccales archaeon]
MAIFMRIVLFVCVGNSFRSQVAEAYFNKYAPQGWVAVSAGIIPEEKVHQNAIVLMQEEGIDISHKKPRRLNDELQEMADVAVVVCSGDFCPILHAKQVEKWPMPDPHLMPLDEARRVRDKIKEKVIELTGRLTER